MTLTSKEKYLIDTNILLYALDRKSPLHPKAKALLELGLHEGTRLVVAHQNILECIGVLTRGYKVPRGIALREVIAFTSAFEQIAPFPGTIDTFLSLMRRAKAVYVFDMYLAATMLDNNVERIITANTKDFQGTGLKEVVAL
jgi:predicted nucleic acid-binding protein